MAPAPAGAILFCDILLRMTPNGEIQEGQGAGILKDLDTIDEVLKGANAGPSVPGTENAAVGTAIGLSEAALALRNELQASAPNDPSQAAVGSTLPPGTETSGNIAPAPPSGPVAPVRDFSQDRRNHPLNRLTRIEDVLDRILGHMATSLHSPISPEDVAELIEYRKNGCADLEDEDDEG